MSANMTFGVEASTHRPKYRLMSYARRTSESNIYFKRHHCFLLLREVPKRHIWVIIVC